MNIAVIDVAADKSGALSVLEDFYKYVALNDECKEHNWFFVTSVVELPERNHIKCIRYPQTKKSWIHRMFWEYFTATSFIKNNNIDIIFSLQNKAIPVKGKRQIVYFHNSLLLNNHGFSILKKEERKLIVYNKIISVLTFGSYKYCDAIIAQTKTVKQMLESKTNKIVYYSYPSVDLKVTDELNGIKGFIYPAAPFSYKRHEDIISAMKLLNCKGKVIFTISGNENTYAKKIKEMISDMNNFECIGMIPREKLLAMYREYGLIFTSAIESFPIPFVEAMSYGSPIVSYNSQYAKEITSGYHNKVLCDSNPNELAVAILDGLEKKRVSGINHFQGSWKKVVDIILSQCLISPI